MTLDENELRKEISQARERMAEQAHPHENRARSLHDMMMGALTKGRSETVDQIGRGISSPNKRKESSNPVFTTKTCILNKQ